MAGGRPTKYNKKYIKEIDVYLSKNKDTVKKGKITVKLPTVEGFAAYIGVSKKTLYNWRDENDEFLHALSKIELEQQKRLINSGLAGQYNSTIAKLILSSNHGMREKSDVTSDNKTLQPLMVKIIDDAKSNGDTDGVSETT